MAFRPFAALAPQSAPVVETLTRAYERARDHPADATSAAAAKCAWGQLDS